MKRIYFLLFVLFGLHIQGQIVNIPDANFKAKLTTLGIDTNNDGNIQVSEAHQVTYLNVSDQNITNLTGINEFINLTFLNCAGNSIITLNLDGLNNLIELNCTNSHIASMSLNGLINLKKITCIANQLITFDASDLISLEELYCDSNELTTLNLNNSKKLKKIYCWGNELESLFLKNGSIETSISIMDNPNLSYICCDDDQVNQLELLTTQNGILNCNVNSYCSFTPGGTFYEITGNSKFDSNNNGCDNLDYNYSNLKFNQTVSNNLVGVYITNQSGNYYIPVQAGSHTITPNLENPNYFTISPTNITVDFPTQTSPFTQDFCVTANGINHDVEVIVLSLVPARPGFDAKYKIIYRNKGNQVENGAITFTYNNAVLDYVSANPVFDSQGTDTFTWNYANLELFETREIEVVFNVNSPMETPAVNNGDQLNFTAQITPMVTDEVLYDNTSAIKQTVVGSYDPNDKTCLEGETVGPDMIGEYVHYLIRFENTGTYPAENVVVKDMIDVSKFDLATLIPLKGSHEFYTRIKDNKVEFIFENINLDFNDATNDGYVAFKIKTKSTLVLGDTFSNDANIYFDYNFPITTNTYTTTIQALSIQDFDFNSKFTLYPNPVQDVLHFNSKENLEIQSVEIYNMLGQIVISVPNSTTSVDVSSLKSGNYFIKVNTEQGISNTKFIKE
ncbi:MULTISPECIES: T9SS type A sorting domain-containing protein [Flavobacterium]|uniref:T9SS type A sorting domain-containing protein n=1 Tax=Flavobacterium jumunjinense TaxID=998845 RepID=A0ABV5GMC0_9FLAO|nr:MULTISPECIES: T9SS type A sorting domain-containing protein [Flavobacterium]